jgi:hypothetical protein
MMTEQNDSGAWIFGNGSKVVFEPCSENAFSGSSFESFLEEENIFDQVDRLAVERLSRFSRPLIENPRLAQEDADFIRRIDHQNRPQPLEGTWKPIDSTRPTPCQGCINYYGKTDGGNKLVCAIHPGRWRYVSRQGGGLAHATQNDDN